MKHTMPADESIRPAPDGSVMLKAIHACEDRQAAEIKAQQVVDKLEMMKSGKAARTVPDGIAETLSYYAFPREHWRGIRTDRRVASGRAGDGSCVWPWDSPGCWWLRSWWRPWS